jgi:threonine dehydrogenase-like Zn-dependent dehydrogenase
MSQYLLLQTKLYIPPIRPELLESGQVRPAIDRRCTLSEVPEALRYLGEGHARGKVVITMGVEE